MRSLMVTRILSRTGAYSPYADFVRRILYS